VKKNRLSKSAGVPLSFGEGLGERTNGYAEYFKRTYTTLFYLTPSPSPKERGANERVQFDKN